MKRVYVLLTLSSFLTGCVTTSSDVVHVLDPGLPFEPSTLVSKVYHSPEDSPVSIIEVDSVRLNLDSIYSPASEATQVRPEKRDDLREQAQALAGLLTAQIRERIATETSLLVRRGGRNVGELDEYHRLELTLTEFYPGSGAARWFIGMGAGASLAQVEGLLKDANGKVLLAFVDRKKNAGSPMLGLNVSVISDDRVLSALANDLASAIVRLLGSLNM